MRDWWMRSWFERLDTSPGQEKAIRSALDDFEDTVRRERRHGVDLSELAVLMTGETFDATAAEGLSGRADSSFAKVRVAAVEALRRIHDTLDEQQRSVLARWLRDRSDSR